MKMIKMVKPETIVLAVRVNSAACEHPELFEPVPTTPVMIDDDGTTYTLADNTSVRADLAVHKRLRQGGLDIDDITAVFVRIAHLAGLVADGRINAFVKREGHALSISEGMLHAAASAPCEVVRGFNIRKLTASARRIEAEMGQ